MVKNPPYNAGDVGLIPGRGTKIPHAAGQLSPCATTRAHVLQTTEPTRPGACAPQLEKRKLAQHNEEPVRHNERPCMPQQRSRVPQLRPSTAKNK